MKGYRTYISAAIIAIITGLQMSGIITAEQAQALMALAAAFGLAALRSAIK
jgi:hypothetical protein